MLLKKTKPLMLNEKSNKLYSKKKLNQFKKKFFNIYDLNMFYIIFYLNHQIY